MCRVTMIDGSREFVELVSEALEFYLGCTLTGFDTASVEFGQVVETHPPIMIVDLPVDAVDRLSAWQLIAMARSHPALQHVPIILTSGDLHGTRARLEELSKVANVRLLDKPFEYGELESLVTTLMAAQPLPPRVEIGRTVRPWRETPPAGMAAHSRRTDRRYQSKWT